MGHNRNTYKVLIQKPEGKRPLGRSPCTWNDNIKTGLKEIGRKGVKWIQDRRPVAGFCEHGNEPSDSIKHWRILNQLRNY
jgi:hypothetical protein